MAEDQLNTPIKVWYESMPGMPTNKWPLVKVKFSVLPQPIFALVDSGASVSVLGPEVAYRLGYTKQKLGKPRFSGKSVSGEYKSWQLPETLSAEMYGFPLSFKFEVIDNLDLSWPCILGEDSIFQMARLDFSRFKGYFEIRFRKDLN